jgi:hypothetical protein
MREMCRRISLALVLRFLKRMKERMMIREPRMERQHDTPTTARRVLSLNKNAVCNFVRLAACILIVTIAALLVSKVKNYTRWDHLIHDNTSPTHDINTAHAYK